MSSLLRSANLLKSLSFAQKIFYKPRHSAIFTYLPSAVSISTNERRYGFIDPHREVSPSEKWIRRLDLDVRRIGRVSMKDLQEAFEEINKSKASSSQALMLIRCCGNLLPEELPVSKSKFVNDIWQSFEQKGILMDVSHYNALLLVYLENEFEFSPLDFLRDMEKKEVEPNRVTYQRLIAAYCQLGNIAGATQILEFMKEKSMPISESVFCSLITGHSIAKDMDSALGILKVMEQANVFKTSETFSALLCAYARNGDLAGLSETFQTATSNGIDFSDRQLLEVIYCLSVNHHYSLVDSVIERLQKVFGYNQDAKNVILRLISRGEDDAAIKVFRTMPRVQLKDEMTVPSGTFLVKQMVRCSRSYETILKFCKELIESKDNERALSYAVEASLVGGKADLSLQLLSSLAKLEPVCQHYYWPVIVQFGNAKDEEGVIRTLKQMMIETKSPVSNETLREYVIQYFNGTERGIQRLRQASVSVASAASATVAYHLQKNNLLQASKICTQYRANYNLNSIRKGLVSAYKAKPDAASLVKIVRCLAAPTENEFEENIESDPVGNCIWRIISVMPTETQAIIDVLEGFLHYGLTLSPEIEARIRQKMDTNMKPEISTLLKRLTSPDLKLVPIDRPFKEFSSAKNEALLLQEIEEAQKNNQPTENLKLRLLKVYTESNEVEKSSKLRDELFGQGAKVNTEMLLSLMDASVKNEKLDDAMFYYSEALKDPTCSVSSLQVVRMGILLAEQDQFDDILKMLERHKLPITPTELTFAHTSACWKMLCNPTEKGDVANTEKLFYSLINNNHIMVTNVLLGCLVKVHIVNNDNQAALEAFEMCCKKYKCTPCKNELSCKLIRSEDAASLQQLTDLSSQIHGEVNTLYDLVLSFVECDKIRQARKILETPGLRSRQTRLNSACERYKNDGRVAYLENLIDATKGIPHVDRSLICYNLLGAYCHINDHGKSLALWTRMQDENIRPTDQFLVKLSDLLKRNKLPIPFAVPAHVIHDSVAKVQRNFNENSALKSLRRAVYGKDLEAALLIKQQIRDVDLQINDRSSLLNLLINNGRLGEATKMCIQCLEQGLRPNIRTLGIIVNSVAKNGDVDSLKTMGKFLDDDLKRLISYTNRLAHCMVEAGQASKVIKFMEESIAKAKTPEEIQMVKDSFPRGGIFSVLQKSNDLVKQFEEIEPKYREKGILEPANALWVHYLLENNSEKLKHVWGYIKGLERIMFKPILKKARADNNLEYIDKLLENVKDANIPPRAVGAIHSCALDILLNQQKIDECEERLDTILKTFPIEHLNYNTLKKLKTGLENTGKSFKYELPKKIQSVKSAPSSSSDSDDEKKISERRGYEKN